MSTDNVMKDLVNQFAPRLRAQEAKLRCFDRQGVQVEGWLKGELLCFLERQRTQGRVEKFEREAKIDPTKSRGRRIDFWICVQDGRRSSTCWLEIKHWALKQKGKVYKPDWYLAYKQQPGIYPDAHKLSSLPTGAKYVLVLMTANSWMEYPESWDKGIGQFNKKFKPLRLRPLTDPSQFSKSYCLGLFRVIGKSPHHRNRRN
jgi:hypothetical protein